MEYIVYLPEGKWYICKICNGSSQLYEQGDAHRSPGIIPCPHCNSNGMVTTETITEEEYNKRKKNGKRKNRKN